MLNVSEIIQTIRELVEVRVQIIKDEILDQVSTVLSRIMILILMGITSLMVLLFASISLAFYISELTYSTYKGFLYVGLLYVLLFIFLYFLRDMKSLQGSLQRFLRIFIFKFKK